MDLLIKIDGNLSLADNESRCEHEQEAGYKLNGIKFGTEIAEGQVLQINKAEFDLANVIDILNDLSFVRAKDSDTIEAVKAKMPGWTLICDTQIYVQNQLQRVVVFGRQVD